MKFSIEKNYILNKLKIVEKISSLRAMNPILSNILIEVTEDNKLKLMATDMDLAVETVTVANVEQSGKVTLPSKKLIEIINKLPDKPIIFEMNDDDGAFMCKIKCQNSKFDMYGISANDFPPMFKGLDINEEISIETEPFVNCIDHTAFAAASYENRNIISGVFFEIKDNKLEMAATDGNRLCRYVENINTQIEEKLKAIVPARTMNEFARIISISQDKKINIGFTKSKIIFKADSFTLLSNLLEGDYPPYNQLIPKEYSKTAIVSTQNFHNALDLVSTMVNDKTCVVKLCFRKEGLELSAETPDTGKSKDVIEVDYSVEDELNIAFNYKYLAETVKNIKSDNLIFGLGGPLAATILRPQSEEDYICLIMPIQLR